MNMLTGMERKFPPLRVLVVTNMYPSPDRPGYGSFVKSQVDSLVERGVEADVLAIPGYRSKLHYLWGMVRVFFRATFGRYDLIHAHYGLSGLAARAQFRLPVVVSYCGDDLYGHADANGRPTATSRFWVWCHKRLAGMVDGVICKSAAMRRLLPGQLGEVIANGVDFSTFRPLDKATCRRELGLDADTAYVLFPYDPGRVRKNVVAAREAVRTAARRSGRRVELLVTHGKPNADMPRYLNAADVLILCSYWEGSPNAVKEAMACNLPVVSVAVGDVPELLDGVAGCHVVDQAPDALAEGLTRVLTEGPERTDGRERSTRLRIETVAEKVIGVYRDTLARRHPPGRVLIIVENLPVPFDRRVWMEATSLHAAGYEVTVICPATDKYPRRHEVLDGITILRHPLPPERGGMVGYIQEYAAALFWQSWLTFRVAVTRGFDVIHACNPPDLIFLVAAPYRLFGKRFLFDQHDLWPHLYEIKFGRRGVLYQALRLCERLTFALADRSIATNESFKALAVERNGMKPERVAVVRSCPNLETFRPAEPLPHLRRPGRVLAGYLGIMAEQDGVHNLIDAAYRITNELGRRDLGVLLIGDGPSRGKLERRVARLGLQDVVHFTGFLTGEDMRRHLSSCDFFVAPDESNPMNDLLTMNKIMEYMAIGRPIAMYDLPEGRSMARDAALYAADGSAGALADVMLALMDDAPLRQCMGASGLARVHQEFSWKREQLRLIACYDELFAAMGRPMLHPATSVQAKREMADATPAGE